MADIPNELLRVLLDNTIRLKQLYGKMPDLAYTHCAESLLESDIRRGRELLRNAGVSSSASPELPPGGEQALIRETLRCIAARILRAKSYLDNDEKEAAIGQLDALLRILPEPTTRHLCVAEVIHEHH